MRVLFILCTLLAFIIPRTTYAEDPGLNFKNLQGNDAWEWLGERQFIFERSADNKKKTNLEFTDQGLRIDALDSTQSIMAIKKGGHLADYKNVLLKWGVNDFPEGASYAKGKRNEAIMFYAFFGTEMIDSGSMLVPDSPYFIALHLCENDQINKPELGRFYHKGGRFVCVAHPKPGEIVTTRFNLKRSFQEYFGFDAPPLYGIALEFDTNGAPNNGKTSAFVRSIEFPDATLIRHQYND